MNITFDMIPQCLSEIIERLGKIEQRLEESDGRKNKNDEFFPSTYRKVKCEESWRAAQRYGTWKDKENLQATASEVNVITNVPRLKFDTTCKTK